MKKKSLYLILVQFCRILNGNVWPIFVLFSNNPKDIIYIGIGLAISNPIYLYLMYTSEWRAPNPSLKSTLKLQKFGENAIKLFFIISILFISAFIDNAWVLVPLLLLNKLFNSSIYLFSNILMDQKDFPQLFKTITVQILILVQTIALFFADIFHIVEILIIHTSLCAGLNLLFKKSWYNMGITIHGSFFKNLMFNSNIAALSALMFSSIVPLQRIVGSKYLNEASMAIFVKLQLTISLGLVIVNFILPAVIRYLGNLDTFQERVEKTRKVIAQISLYLFLLICTHVAVSIFFDYHESSVTLILLCLLCAIHRSVVAYIRHMQYSLMRKVYSIKHDFAISAFIIFVSVIILRHLPNMVGVMSTFVIASFALVMPFILDRWQDAE